MLLSEAIAEITGKNQHALIMNAAAQMSLSLDVDNTRLAHTDAGGHPARPTKSVTADLHHREAVDLADFFSGNFNQNGAVGAQLANLFFDSIRAEYAAFESSVDMARRDNLAVVLARPERRLAN